MLTLGIDAHKRARTIVAVGPRGRQLAVKTIGTNTRDHLGLLTWAEQIGSRAGDGGGLLWAVEDCRHLSRRLEHDLLAAGQSIVRVSPKLMAHVRGLGADLRQVRPDRCAGGRPRGVAGAGPAGGPAGWPGPRGAAADRPSGVAGRRTDPGDLPAALAPARTRPGLGTKTRSLDRISAPDQVQARIAGQEGTVARLARILAGRCRELTAQINELTTELTAPACAQAPALIAIFGCGTLTAAKILGETAGVDRFRSKDAYARHNGTAPLPVWSSNKARHRLSRTGNRQLNPALHRIAMTQAHRHPPAKEMMDRRKASGDSGLEALRVLKRRLSDVVYAALQADLAAKPLEPTSNSATAAA